MKEEEELDGFHETGSDDSIQSDDDVLRENDGRQKLGFKRLESEKELT